MTDIINRVTESGLISLDLADYKPTQEIVGIDISEQLWQGLVLKEKDFRDWIKSNDWTFYENKAVYIHCSADAILPVWAYLLISSKLIDVAYLQLVGNEVDIQKTLFVKNVQKLDFSPYTGVRVVIKGCSDIPFPEFSMVELVKCLQPIVKSLMFGEPCSTVPIYKKK